MTDRSYSEALRYFGARKRAPFRPTKTMPALHRDALKVLVDLGCGELAPDFIVLGPRQLAETTKEVDWPAFELGTRWSLFAMSGTGDAWLASLGEDDCRIAFGDHGSGDSSKPRELRIDPSQWVCLAQVMSNFVIERRKLWRKNAEPLELEELGRRTKAAMDSISAGLVGRYPYRLTLARPRFAG